MPVCRVHTHKGGKRSLNKAGLECQLVLAIYSKRANGSFDEKLVLLKCSRNINDIESSALRNDVLCEAAKLGGTLISESELLACNLTLEVSENYAIIIDS